jgi:nitroreductase
MEFNDVLEKRHSCRVYSGREVEPGKLGAVLEAARSAPSAGNLQSYYIYIVRAQALKEDIMRASNDQELIAQVPVLLIFCADKNPGYKYGEKGAEFYSVQDATIAAAFAQLSATDQGLGSVWVGGFDPLEVSRLINAEPHHVPVAIIPLGYPADEAGPRERKPLDEIVKEAG